jgi:hypothetical protein
MEEQKMKDEEYEIYDVKGSDDGTFFMCYKDWRTYYNNLFLAIDFPPTYRGVRYSGQWTETTSGGFPKKNDVTTWSQSPQFFIKLKKSTKIFISLGQPDGKIKQLKFN